MARKNLACFIRRLRNTLLCLIVFFLIFIHKERSTHKVEVAKRLPKTALKYLFFDKVKYNMAPHSPHTLRSLINQENNKRMILNTDLYGPIHEDTVIFVITVDELSIYFEFLLVSLTQIRGIDEVLLVFSHKHYDENLNKLIQSIDFCRVVQIFYPYSIELYPDHFPGRSPNDCDHDLNIPAARDLNCTGSNFPDVHGYFRDPINSQSKHFWWWTSNTVFETLLSSKDHKGIVVFLKDDIYILPDFIYTILYMKEIADSFNNCEFFTLECMPYSYSCIRNTHGLEVKTWDPKQEPSVLAFDAVVWKSIVSHYDLYCSIDDYSWYRSIFYISMKRQDGLRYRIMSSLFPKAFKTSSCGLDGILVDCDAIESVYQVLEIQKSYSYSLFPAYLEVYFVLEIEEDFLCFDYAESNGGWSDPRDKDLCFNMTMNKIRKFVDD